MRLVLHRGRLDDPGWLGPYYTDEADPGTTNFVPRPDWYFYFLFYLLRIFKWPDTVVLGTVGVPNMLLAILLALPFIDLRRERRLSRRPVAIVAAIVVVLAMGTLTYKGATAKESLGSETIQEVPDGPKSRASPTTRRPLRARSSSRSPAACSATPTSAAGLPTSAHPTSATSARRTRASTTSSAT